MIEFKNDAPTEALRQLRKIHGRLKRIEIISRSPLSTNKAESEGVLIHIYNFSDGYKAYQIEHAEDNE